MPKNYLIKSCIVAVGFTLSATAMADAVWSFSSSACSGYNSSYAAYSTCTSTGAPTSAPDVSVKAYADTGTSRAIENAYVGVYSADPANLGVSNRGKVTSGIDANEGTSPEHSMDNNERYDSLLLSFASAITMTKVQLGWYSTDSDITILAYTGTGTPTLLGKTYSSLISSGWTLVGDYSNVGTSEKTVNAGNISSSYWLIGAYNPLGGTAKYSLGDDYVKLATISGYQTPGHTVPEPSSLFLVGTALLGAGIAKRRKSK